MSAELGNLREDLEVALDLLEELADERKVICGLLYALGVPSVSEDGYGENVQRLKYLLDKEAQKDNPNLVPGCPHGFTAAEARTEHQLCAYCDAECPHWLPLMFNPNQRITLDFDEITKDAILNVLKKFPGLELAREFEEAIRLPGETILTATEALVLAGLLRQWYPFTAARLTYHPGIWGESNGHSRN